MQLNTAQRCAKRVRPEKESKNRPLFNLKSPKPAGTSVPTLSEAVPDKTSPAAFDRHIEVQKRPKMPLPTALFASILMQCQRRLQISQVKSIISANFSN